MKKIIFLIGESGCGKTTLQNNLINDYPHKYTRIISSTTRPPRNGEVDGLSYNFLSRENFEYLIEGNKLLQHTSFGGNYYGTRVEDYFQKQDVGIFVCTPIGVTDTIEALRNKCLDNGLEFEIILFMTTKNLLKRHDIPKERIDRGNILQDFMKMYVNNCFDGIDISILRDVDINESLSYKINNISKIKDILKK